MDTAFGYVSGLWIRPSPMKSPARPYPSAPETRRRPTPAVTHVPAPRRISARRRISRSRPASHRRRASAPGRRPLVRPAAIEEIPPLRRPLASDEPQLDSPCSSAASEEVAPLRRGSSSRELIPSLFSVSSSSSVRSPILRWLLTARRWHLQI